jgi:hypothetical protein
MRSTAQHTPGCGSPADNAAAAVPHSNGMMTTGNTCVRGKRHEGIARDILQVHTHVRKCFCSVQSTFHPSSTAATSQVHNARTHADTTALPTWQHPGSRTWCFVKSSTDTTRRQCASQPHTARKQHRTHILQPCLKRTWCFVKPSTDTTRRQCASL